MITHQSKEELIQKHMPLVKSIAKKYYINNYNGLEFEDLVSYGIIGLIDAINKFKLDKGVKFSTYASFRIRGEILDKIRMQSPISKTILTKINIYNKVVEDLQKKLNREPKVTEISERMNITNEEVLEIEKNIHIMSITSLDELLFDDKIEIYSLTPENDINIESQIVEEEKIEILRKSIEKLKDKDKIVLSLYYFEELTLKEIGLVLDVSESRVSQIHRRAIINLKNIMKNNYL